MTPKVPPDVVTLAGGLGMWLLDRQWPWAYWLKSPVTWLAAIPTLLGGWLIGTAVAEFRRAHTTVNPMIPSEASTLVIRGIYRYTRNPMYVGLLLVLVGWAIWLGSASPWLVPPVFVVLMTVAQIRPEEAALTARFGERYRDYCQAVPRWVGIARHART